MKCFFPTRPTIALSVLATLFATSASAALDTQPMAKPRAAASGFENDLHRLSPHQTINLRDAAGHNRVMVIYGRPHTVSPVDGKPRIIWGGLVPYGKVWRLGADEATLLITQRPIVLGNASLPAGAYSLFLLPTDEQTAELIVNQNIGEWGLEYDPSRDIVHIPMHWQGLDQPVEQFTMDLQGERGGGGRLVLKWAKEEFSLGFRTVTEAKPKG